MNRTVLVVAALMAFAPAANAQDQGEAYDWSGFHIGVNAGYASQYQDNLGSLPFGGNIGGMSNDGAMGGAQIGYDHQISNIVLGMEADIQFSGETRSDFKGVVTVTNDSNIAASLRARVGYAIDNTLIYATGGLAKGYSDFSADAGPFRHDEGSFDSLGYTLGAGIEYGIDDNVSVKLEYLYTDLGEDHQTVLGLPVNMAPDLQTVRLGLNFRF